MEGRNEELVCTFTLNGLPRLFCALCADRDVKILLMLGEIAGSRVLFGHLWEFRGLQRLLIVIHELA